eukprot:Sspe_Gene.20805::Locus_7670_Transcript_1_1_Confidence_1.000_Length_1162::g.20805::m.20805
MGSGGGGRAWERGEGERTSWAQGSADAVESVTLLVGLGGAVVHPNTAPELTVPILEERLEVRVGDRGGVVEGELAPVQLVLRLVQCDGDLVERNLLLHVFECLVFHHLVLLPLRNLLRGRLTLHPRELLGSRLVVGHAHHNTQVLAPVALNHHVGVGGVLPGGHVDAMPAVLEPHTHLAVRVVRADCLPTLGLAGYRPRLSRRRCRGCGGCGGRSGGSGGSGGGRAHCWLDVECVGLALVRLGVGRGGLVVHHWGLGVEHGDRGRGVHCGVGLGGGVIRVARPLLGCRRGVGDRCLEARVIHFPSAADGRSGVGRG